MKFLERLTGAQDELTKEKKNLLKKIATALQKIKRELRVQKGELYFKEVLFSIKYTGKTGLRLSEIKLTSDDANTWFSFVADGEKLKRIKPDHIEGVLTVWRMEELQELLNSLINEDATEENTIIEAEEI